MSGFLSSFNKTNKANNNSGRDDGMGRISASSVPTADMRFTIEPTGESDFSQWVAAMKMVAQLPGGIPPEFRRRLWVTMAERHLASRGVDWSRVEKTCFGDWSQHADDELGIQIVKDLHRTGCSLFCGDEGQQNQALLKKVLMAYARWNKAVGYCQGFNMLAALILQVTDRCASDALKLMIYLIEGVLPDCYFADSLRGLSVDMAVFRELLRSKLPRLSKHLDLLQSAAKDGARSYEPPLTNVFTMQWFLTLFCNCLPHPTVLRVWDLIFLEGNAVLLRTAIAIWQVLAQRILLVRTADEFYCVMGALTRELLESNLIDADTLVEAIVAVGPITELKSLREHYLYNITPWGAPAPTARPTISLHPKMDIGALKQQYVKLKQRQRQAHVIFTTAVSGRPAPAATPVMNHLLVGKRALGPSKRAGPPKGSIPPARQHHQAHHPSTLHWKDAAQPPTAAATTCSSSSSSDTELCDEDDVQSSEDDAETEASQFVDNSKPTTTTSDSLIPSPNLKIPSDCEEGDQSAEFELFLADRLKSSDSLTAKVTSDSEEGDDFERFLADRLKGDQAARRNSELALQIIQENSLILHRIMQCQSRLSPSPPLLGETLSIKDDCDPAIKDFQTNLSLVGEANPTSTLLIQTQPVEDDPDSPLIKYDFEPISSVLIDQKLSIDYKCDTKMQSDYLPIKNLTEPRITVIEDDTDFHLIKDDSDPTHDFDSISQDSKLPFKDEFHSKTQLSSKCDSESQLLLNDKTSSEAEFAPIRDSDPKLIIKEELKPKAIKLDFDQSSSSFLTDDLQPIKDLISPLLVENLPIEDNNSEPKTQSNEVNFDSEGQLLDDRQPIKDSLMLITDFKMQPINDDSPTIKDDSNAQSIKHCNLLIENVDTKLDDSLTDANQYSSRLRSLLEKSKSLDEKYNFMLNKDKLTPTLGGLHESKSEEPLTRESDKDNKSSQLIQENLHLLKAYSANKIKEERTSLSRKLFRENVCLLESISSKSDSALFDFLSPQNDLVLSPLTDSNAITTVNESIGSSARSIDYNLSSPVKPSDDDNCDKFELTSIDSSAIDFNFSSPVKSDSVLSPDDDNCDKFESTSFATSLNSSSPNKSPNHATFNPFPVSINSRQNKEVAVKLGLYKK